MLRKKIKTLALSTILVVGTFCMVGCSKGENTEDDTFKVTLVLTEGGVNDKSFNESAYKGALEAQEEYGVEVTYLESLNKSDYTTNIETAVDNNSDLIIGVGFEMATAIEKSAVNYPDQLFATIDGTFEGEIPKNVVSITFDEEQSGYLVGLIAGKMTETNTIGFVGGMEIPSVSNFLVGYEKGAKEVNPDIKILKQYANSFSDTAKGKAIANQMLSNSADILFTAGGGVNQGVFESVAEKGKKAIGVDMKSNYQAPDIIITSALKNVDTGVKTIIKDTLDGNFKGGEAKLFNIDNNGVGFEETSLLPDDVVEFVQNKIAELKK